VLACRKTFEHAVSLAWCPPHTQVTLVGESFGGCLALRVAAAAPDLVERLVR